MQQHLTDREKRIFLLEYLDHPSTEHYTLVHGLRGECLNQVYYPLAALDELSVPPDEEGERRLSSAAVLLLSLVAQRLTEILALEVNLLCEDVSSSQAR